MSQGYNALVARPIRPYCHRMPSKVLVANRGEIAVRIIRACRDAGIVSVAVYADCERESLHVKLADEAYALHGNTATQTYLRSDKLLDVAKRSGADAVHPGYGFLAENAAFAEAVRGAGLTWVGPSPEAIESLGDKVEARRVAEKVGAPLVAGTPGPVDDVDAVLAFADEHGLPLAIKAAFGGGGRGMKVVRTREEIPEAFTSAVREATAAFGRGECFVERYLDRPRHVETQCLADAHGAVVVVSTRDCSLQRRHQKLVEEAPAPFLDPEVEATMRRSSIDILTAVGYVGAGTVEFLVGADGTLSFLEVNTRLQVEHTVSEEISGIDLVGEQLRIADGEPLGYTEVSTRGHSIEFRINGEDVGAGFMPCQGRLGRFEAPTGPGVRLDTGVLSGDLVSGAFDSMMAKLVITGATREQALARARRALAEFTVEGVPTVLPFHRAVLDDPAFAPSDGSPFTVHTRWIETEWTNGVPPAEPRHVDAVRPPEREVVVVEVGGKRLEVVLPGGLGSSNGASGHVGSPTGMGPSRRPRRRTSSAARAPVRHGKGGVTAPMQGTVVQVAVAEGQKVAEGDLVLVLEAMKMEQPLLAHRSGVVSGLSAGVGESLSTGSLICDLVEA